jgi:hypothetical protein
VLIFPGEGKIPQPVQLLSDLFPHPLGRFPILDFDICLKKYVEYFDDYC